MLKLFSGVDGWFARTCPDEHIRQGIYSFLRFLVYSGLAQMMTEWVRRLGEKADPWIIGFLLLGAVKGALKVVVLKKTQAAQELNVDTGN